MLDLERFPNDRLWPLFGEHLGHQLATYLARLGRCSTMWQDVTHVGENWGAHSGPVLGGGCPKVAESDIVADFGGRWRARLGRIPGLSATPYRVVRQRGGRRI